MNALLSLLSTIDSLSSAEKKTLLARLLTELAEGKELSPALPLLDDQGQLLGCFVPRLHPAEKTTVPDFPPEYLAELKRRVATPEKVVSWEEFRAMLDLEDARKCP